MHTWTLLVTFAVLGALDGCNAVGTEAFRGTSKALAHQRLSADAGAETDVGAMKCCNCEKWDGIKGRSMAQKRSCVTEAVRMKGFLGMFRAKGSQTCAAACAEEGATAVTSGTKKRNDNCREHELKCSGIYTARMGMKYCRCVAFQRGPTIGRRQHNQVSHCWVHTDADMACALACNNAGSHGVAGTVRFGDVVSAPDRPHSDPEC